MSHSLTATLGRRLRRLSHSGALSSTSGAASLRRRSLDTSYSGPGTASAFDLERIMGHDEAELAAAAEVANGSAVSGGSPACAVTALCLQDVTGKLPPPSLASASSASVIAGSSLVGSVVSGTKTTTSSSGDSGGTRSSVGRRSLHQEETAGLLDSDAGGLSDSMSATKASVYKRRSSGSAAASSAATSIIRPSLLGPPPPSPSDLCFIATRAVAPPSSHNAALRGITPIYALHVLLRSPSVAKPQAQQGNQSLQSSSNASSAASGGGGSDGGFLLLVPEDGGGASLCAEENSALRASVTAATGCSSIVPPLMNGKITDSSGCVDLACLNATAVDAAVSRGWLPLSAATAPPAAYRLRICGTDVALPPLSAVPAVWLWAYVSACGGLGSGKEAMAVDGVLMAVVEQVHQPIATAGADATASIDNYTGASRRSSVGHSGPMYVDLTSSPFLSAPTTAADVTGGEAFQRMLVCKLRLIAAGAPCVVCLIGPPGVGKTALLGRFVREGLPDATSLFALPPGGRVSSSAAEAVGSNASLSGDHAIVNSCKMWLRWARSYLCRLADAWGLADETAAAERVLRELKAARDSREVGASEAVCLSPRLWNRCLGLHIAVDDASDDGTLAQGASAEQGGKDMSEEDAASGIVLLLLRNLTSHTPAVLLIDDCERMTAVERSVTQAVVEAISSSSHSSTGTDSSLRLMLVLSERNSGSVELVTPPPSSSIISLHLRPLDRHASDLLVASLLRWGGAISPHLLAHVWHACRGNPQATQELTLALLAEGRLGQRPLPAAANNQSSKQTTRGRRHSLSDLLGLSSCGRFGSSSVVGTSVLQADAIVPPPRPDSALADSAPSIRRSSRHSSAAANEGVPSPLLPALSQLAEAARPRQDASALLDGTFLLTSHGISHKGDSNTHPREPSLASSTASSLMHAMHDRLSSMRRFGGGQPTSHSSGQQCREVIDDGAASSTANDAGHDNGGGGLLGAASATWPVVAPHPSHVTALLGSRPRPLPLHSSLMSTVSLFPVEGGVTSGDVSGSVGAGTLSYTNPLLQAHAFDAKARFASTSSARSGVTFHRATEPSSATAAAITSPACASTDVTVAASCLGACGPLQALATSSGNRKGPLPLLGCRAVSSTSSTAAVTKAAQPAAGHHYEPIAELVLLSEAAAGMSASPVTSSAAALLQPLPSSFFAGAYSSILETSIDALPPPHRLLLKVLATGEDETRKVAAEQLTSSATNSVSASCGEIDLCFISVGLLRRCMAIAAGGGSICGADVDGRIPSSSAHSVIGGMEGDCGIPATGDGSSSTDLEQLLHALSEAGFITLPSVDGAASVSIACLLTSALLCRRVLSEQSRLVRKAVREAVAPLVAARFGGGASRRNSLSDSSSLQQHHRGLQRSAGFTVASLDLTSDTYRSASLLSLTQQSHPLSLSRSSADSGTINATAASPDDLCLSTDSPHFATPSIDGGMHPFISPSIVDGAVGLISDFSSGSSSSSSSNSSDDVYAPASGVRALQLWTFEAKGDFSTSSHPRLNRTQLLEDEEGPSGAQQLQQYQQLCAASAFPFSDGGSDSLFDPETSHASGALANSSDYYPQATDDDGDGSDGDWQDDEGRIDRDEAVYGHVHNARMDAALFTYVSANAGDGKEGTGLCASNGFYLHSAATGADAADGSDSGSPRRYGFAYAATTAAALADGRGEAEGSSSEAVDMADGATDAIPAYTHNSAAPLFGEDSIATGLDFAWPLRAAAADENATVAESSDVISSFFFARGSTPPPPPPPDPLARLRAGSVPPPSPPPLRPRSPADGGTAQQPTPPSVSLPPGLAAGQHALQLRKKYSCSKR